jgi:hypothetical protein
MHATSSRIFTIIVGLRLVEEEILLHCTDVEKGVGEEMIHLLGPIMKTCSFAGINLNFQSL